MSIEKIERVREVMSWLNGWDGNRSAASFRGFQSITLGDIRALLDELSRLREALQDIAASDDIDNALDPARNKRVAARALSEGQE